MKLHGETTEATELFHYQLGKFRADKARQTRPAGLMTLPGGIHVGGSQEQDNPVSFYVPKSNYKERFVGTCTEIQILYYNLSFTSQKHIDAAECIPSTTKSNVFIQGKIITYLFGIASNLAEPWT